MKNKNLIIAAAAVVIIAGFIFILKPLMFKKEAAKPPAAQKAALKAAVKKPISKDMGALRVNIAGPKNRELVLRIRAFKSADSRSSTYVSSFTSGRMAELLPGRYDIEIDTTPQKIYKGIEVVMGRETIENLGRITGTLNVKVLNAKKKEGYYPVKLYQPKPNILMAATTANRPVEILAGVYDIEIGVLPKVVETDVKVQTDKDTILDLGVLTGTLVVKALDQNRKEMRYGVRIRKAENNGIVTLGASNRPAEIRQGNYNIELLSSPAQTKNNVKVNAGEESIVEFAVQTAAPAKEAVSAKTAEPAPAKK